MTREDEYGAMVEGGGQTPTKPTNEVEEEDDDDEDGEIVQGMSLTDAIATTAAL